jgi:hypothetical protein
MEKAEEVSAEVLGGPLVLRHASKRSSGWRFDDYDVIHEGRDIGRIFKPRAGAPDDRPWMWTIKGQAITATRTPPRRSNALAT